MSLSLLRLVISDLLPVLNTVFAYRRAPHWRSQAVAQWGLLLNSSTSKSQRKLLKKLSLRTVLKKLSLKEKKRGRQRMPPWWKWGGNLSLTTRNCPQIHRKQLKRCRIKQMHQLPTRSFDTFYGRPAPSSKPLFFAAVWPLCNLSVSLKPL